MNDEVDPNRRAFLSMALGTLGAVAATSGACAVVAPEAKDPPAPADSQDSEVRRMILASGINPAPDELELLISMHPEIRARVARLYEIRLGSEL